jgi:hypothetical protein
VRAAHDARPAPTIPRAGCELTSLATSAPGVLPRARRLPSAALRMAKRDRLAALLVLIGVASAIVAIAQAPAVIAQLYRDADTAVAFVMPQLAGHLPPGTVTDLGNHSWYEAWWFMRATVGVPDHLLLWEVAPYVFAFVGIAAVAWTARLALGWRAALYTAVALLAIGGALRQVVFEPDVRVGMLLHLALLCGALLIVWKRARAGSSSRRWLVAGGVALAAFTAAGTTDQLLTFDGVIPFVLAPCLWWWRNNTPAARTVALFAILTGVGAVIGGEILSKIMEHEGVGASLSLGSFQFVQTADIAASFANTAAAWAALGNGSFFDAQVSRSSALAFVLGGLSLLALGAILRMVWISAGAWWRARSEATADSATGGRDLFVAFWGLAVVITLATNTLTSTGQAANSRYLIAGWTGVAALLGALVTTRHGRAVMTASIAVFAAAIAGQNIKDGVQPPGVYYTPAQVTQISRFVERHGARIGYGAYANSHNFTWATRFKVKVFPVWPCPLRPGSVCQRPLSSISAWFIPRPGTRTFLITGAQSPAIPTPPATFGPALATATFGPYTVRVYGHDVAAQILQY